MNSIHLEKYISQIRYNKPTNHTINENQFNEFNNRVISELENQCIDEDTPAGYILNAMQSDGVMDVVDFEVAAIKALEMAGHTQTEDLDKDDILELIGAGLNMNFEEVGDRIEMGSYRDEDYEQIHEGFFDRMKARGSQALGTIKGTGQQIAGKAQQMAGKAVGGAGNLLARGIEAAGGTIDPSKNVLAQKGTGLTKAGKKQQGAGKRAGEEAKYKSYIANSAKTIANDLLKLGMTVNDEAALIADIQKVISQHLTQVTASGQLKTPAAKGGGAVVGSRYTNS